MEGEQAVNRKRIVALMLAAVMALPSHVYAEPAAPGGADMPLLEETGIQAGMPETEDGRTEAPAAEDSKEEAPVQDTGNAPADPTGSEELAEPEAPTLDTGNGVDGSEEDSVTGTEDAAGAGEGSEGDSAQEPAAVTYDLWIGGAQVTDQNLSGSGWTYDPENKILTLADAELTSTGDYAVMAEDDLTITGTGTLSAGNIVICQTKGSKLTLKKADLTLKSAGSYLIRTIGAVDISDSTITYITEEGKKSDSSGIDSDSLRIAENSKVTIHSSKGIALKARKTLEIADSVVEAVSDASSAITAGSISVTGKSNVKAETSSAFDGAVQVGENNGVPDLTLGDGLLILDDAKPNESKRFEISYTYLVTVEGVYSEGSYKVGEVKDNIYTGYYSAGKNVTVWTGERSPRYVLDEVILDGIEANSLNWSFDNPDKDPGKEDPQRFFTFIMPEKDVSITLKWKRISDEPDIIGDFKVDENGKLIGFRDDVTSLPSRIEIPAEVTEIPEGVFSEGIGRKVTEVTFEVSSSLKVIGDNAFKNSSLQKIIFKSQLESIGKGAFDSCSDLRTVTMPKGVKTIGAEAFRNCTHLSEIDVTNAETIGDQAFEACSALTEKAFGDNQVLSRIGNHAFRNCKGIAVLKLRGRTAKTVSFGTGVFQGCTELVAVDLPDGLVEISEEAFRDCIAMEEAVVPASVIAVRDSAFRGCKALKKVTINNQDGPDGTSAVILVETSFPSERGKELTLWGYDGTVEEHAGQMGYTFQTRFEKYTVSEAETVNSEQGEIKFSTALNGALKKSVSVVAGKKVYVRLIPKSNYWVRPGSVSLESKFEECVLEKVDGKEVVYSFIIEPSRTSTKVNVSASFDKETEVKKPTVDVEDVGFIRVTRESGSIKTLNFDKAGKEVKLILSTNTNTRDRGSAPWRFKLSSSDPKVAKVESDGTLRSIGMSENNKCIITAEPNVTASGVTPGVSMQFEVTVSAKASPEELQFKLSAFDDLAKSEIITEDACGYPVIRFNSSHLAQASRSFDAVFEALDGDHESVFVSATWSVTDDTIATIESTATEDNRNRITVKKGAVGETGINVSVKRTGDKETLTARLIIQVVDATPRLKEKTVTVNVKSNTGTPFTLVPVYGYDIDESSLVLKEKREDLPYPEATNLIVRNGRIMATGNGGIGNYEKGRFLIEGYYTDEKGGGVFRVPVKLTVTDQTPKPAVTKSGKINLFYWRSDIPDPEAGSVVFKQNIESEEVEKYELVSAEHDQYWNIWEASGRTDPLAANFHVEKDADGNAVVTRNAAELMKLKNKAVTSGYLYIYYKGYTYNNNERPPKVKISIPTVTTKPSCVLSKTKTAISNYVQAGQTYEIELLDKKTKERIDLTGAQVELGTKTTSALKGRIDTGNMVNEAGNLSLRFSGAPVKGKVIFKVQKASWSSAINYTFTLSKTNSLPKPKLSVSSLSFREGSGQSATVKVTWNQPEAKLVNMDVSSSNDGGISVSYNENYEEPGTGVISVQSSGFLYKGTYKFRLKPQWDYGTGYPQSGKNVTLTIKAVAESKKASITLSGNDTLDLLNRDKAAVYKVKMTNVFGAITDIKLEIFDDIYGEIDNEYTIDGSKYFEAKANALEGTVSLYAKKDAVFFKGGSRKIAGNSYKLRMRCMVNGYEVVSKAVTVKVTQKMPTLELDKESLTMYAGERYFPNMLHEVKLTKKTQENVKILKVDWTKDASKARKEAIEIVGYDPGTGKLTLKLKNAARLKMETEYTLPFVAVCEGQFVELDEKDKEVSGGKAFNIKLTIKK
ncbi:MAG TPA: hypothetical protein DD414_02985 [Lachnospiraceae bacterium]|nr:hypothetical protein [Lachnospiraceae bacterium]